MNNPILIFLDLAAGAALLVWSVRLVRTGFERAFGGQLRLWLRRSTADRFRSAACGTLAAILMQSSTAVAVLMAGFVSAGTIAGVSGLAILLGADLGSAIVAQILNSRVSVLAPVLLVVGVVFFLRSQRRRLRQIGRICIGLGLVFVSLDLIRTASLPLVENPTMGVVMSYFANEDLLAFLVAAAFAWLVHSSVAAVLLFVTMAGQGIMPVGAAFAMVLGANLGGSMIAFALTMQSDPPVRRAVLANLILRGGGAALVLMFLPELGEVANYLGSTPDRQALHLHLAFNTVLLVGGLPLVATLYRLMHHLVPDTRGDSVRRNILSALDTEALAQPDRALACAVRELVQAAGRVEAMHRNVLGLFEQFDEDLARQMRDDSALIAEIALELRLYLGSIRNGEDDTARARSFELAGIASELEAAADIIGRKLVGHAETMALQTLKFSEDGWRELADFHDLVLRNTQSAVTVLMNGDPALARSLVEQKEAVREGARQLEQRHLQRLKQGLVESIETSGLHLDVLRAFKEVNTCFAKIAYPTLSQSGDLLKSRLASG